LTGKRLSVSQRLFLERSALPKSNPTPGTIYNDPVC
jgi:hypothetical protein